MHRASAVALPPREGLCQHSRMTRKTTSQKTKSARAAATKPKRIAVVTGGGDCPGLNAVIRAVVLGALNRGWEVYGLERGYDALLDARRVRRLDSGDVRGITHLGGTILGTTNRGNPFKFTVTRRGRQVLADISDQVVRQFARLKFDALVAIGGDGTLRIANDLALKGIPVVGVPKTIDNDLAATEVTFGFNTAVTTATDAIDKLHATAESHERVMVVEVMGRYAGWIALYAGVAGTADVILIPEIPFTLDAVARKINERWRRQRKFAIVVVAEGAKLKGGELFARPQEPGREPLLVGAAEYLAGEIQKLTGKETRALVLGHLQRGGTPTTSDRLLSTRFGAAAVRAVERGERNVMVALRSNQIVTVPLAKAVSRMKAVPLDSDIVQTAREMGIVFGDEDGD
jgi:ATP-dependent phosphofructokinase / diphosphate-dependent phosphofructokinase